MKNTRHFIQIITLSSFAVILLLSSCNQTNIDQKNPVAANTMTASAGKETAPAQTVTKLAADLEKARTEKKTVFLIVSEGNQSTEKLMRAAQDAAKTERQSCILKLKRDEKENAELVTRYGLKGAPVPLVLVIANNGVPIGGVEEKNASAKEILFYIPTPKQAELYLAIEGKKAIFFVISGAGFKDLSAALANCKKATSAAGIPVACIEGNLNDPKETEFYKQLGINLQTKQTTTVVLNADGSVTGIFLGIPDISKLNEAAKRVKKSCCPSGKSC